jgi:hypothetical protein
MPLRESDEKNINDTKKQQKNAFFQLNRPKTAPFCKK